MESYIHLYETNDEFKAAYNSPNYKEPWLSLTEENMTISYNKPKLIDFSAEPLTFNILSAGTINWETDNSSIAKTIDYKLNGGEWTSITSNTDSSAPTITVNPGDKLQLRGNNAQYGAYSKFGLSCSYFAGSALFEAEGNIMSLIYGDDFKNNSTISSTYALAGLFTDCTNLVSAENLILPATTLADYCYREMFYQCTSLTTAPKLPATTLADYCYQSMFMYCSSLTTAPELPADTLANSCYYQMFQGCTSLITAPALPATTLALYCYDEMFSGCKNLNYIKCLATNVSGYSYTNYWVSGVASTGTFVKNPDMASWPTGDNGIPTGWTVQDAS